MTAKFDRGQATRHSIVAAATDLFTRSGYGATSIEDVLDETGVSRGALYHHFAGKEALFEAVLETVEAAIADTILKASRTAKDPVEALVLGCDAFLRLAGDASVKQIVLVDAPAVVGWQKWREIDARHGFGLLKRSLEAAAAAGRARPELVEVLAHLLLAALFEAALIIARADNSKAAMRTAREALRQLIERLLAK